jgi:hypothetical protein
MRELSLCARMLEALQAAAYLESNGYLLSSPFQQLAPTVRGDLMLKSPDSYQL